MVDMCSQFELIFSMLLMKMSSKHIDSSLIHSYRLHLLIDDQVQFYILCSESFSCGFLTKDQFSSQTVEAVHSCAQFLVTG